MTSKDNSPASRTQGHTVNYVYDDAGRLKTVQDWLANTTTYTPNANSFDTGVAYQNGVNVTQTPNDADQNMGITDKLGTATLASMTYTRDGNNQVSGESDREVPRWHSHTHTRH